MTILTSLLRNTLFWCFFLICLPSWAAKDAMEFPTGTPISVVGAGPGSATSGNCAEYDTNGDLVDSGSPCGGSSSGITSINAQDDAVGIGTFTTLNVNSNISGSVSNNVLTIDGGAPSKWLTRTGVGIGTYDAVGIGTFPIGSRLTVIGNVGIATVSSSNFAIIQPSSGNAIIEGNVGIGTFRPTSIIGSDRFVDIGGNKTTPGVTFHDNQGTQEFLMMQNASQGVWFRIGGAADALNNQYFFATSTTNSDVSNTRKIWFPSAGGITVGSTYIANGNRPNANGIMTQGNVTVGTTSVLNMVDINGAIALGSYAGNNGVVSGGMITSANIGIGTTRYQNNMLNVNGSAAIGYAEFVGPTNGLIVSGNIGIGTTTPGAALDTNGNIRSTGWSAGANLCTDANKNATTSGCTGGSGTNYWPLSPGNVGINTTTVNVGIGTISPISLLQVGNAPGMYIDSMGDVGIGTVRTESSALTVMSGNVGIGTWKPEQLLHVKGSILAGTATTDTSTYPYGVNMATTSGNVGIGSANPGFTLDVVGQMRVVNANSAGWSVVTGASTACNTTCTSACVVGFDVGTLGVAVAHLVACTDASADECLCAGAN